MAVYFHLKRGEESDVKSTEVACSSSFIVKWEIETLLKREHINNLLIPFMVQAINYQEPHQI